MPYLVIYVDHSHQSDFSMLWLIEGIIPALICDLLHNNFSYLKKKKKSLHLFLIELAISHLDN